MADNDAGAHAVIGAFAIAAALCYPRRQTA